METRTHKKDIVSDEAFTCIICGITFHEDFMSSEPQICKVCKRKEVVKVNNNSRVFVINYTRKDMSDAKQYGTLISITEGNVDVFNLDRLTWTLEDALDKHTFDLNRDYILLSGGLSMNFVMGSICHKYKKINLLLWDAKNRIYIRKEFKI